MFKEPRSHILYHLIIKKGAINMIILDKPYISSLLKDTITRMNMGVLKNTAIEELELPEATNLLGEEDFTKVFMQNTEATLYCNSENSIDWISKNLAFTALPEQINQCKDKIKFRQILQDEFPDFFYQEVKLRELQTLDVNNIKMPFIIKPAIGFFSVGVYKVSNKDEWVKVAQQLIQEAEDVGKNYPPEVVNAKRFIIEENIEGEEFAVDAYYNAKGEPVVLNILKHIFSSEEDVSDRVYITSKEIIEQHHAQFLDFLKKMGKYIPLKNFPLHAEFRVNADHQVIPIEVNPMRFAGWCTTDIAYYAYDINVYEYYFKQMIPDWKQILQDKADKIYSIVVADCPKDIPVAQIREIDYQRLRSDFKKVLELREINYKEYPVMAFLFTETEADNLKEIEDILTSDLKKYIRLK